MGGFFSFFSKKSDKSKAKAADTPKSSGKSRSVPAESDNPVAYAQQVTEWANQENAELENAAAVGGTISGDEAQAAVDSEVAIGAVTFKTHTEGGAVSVSEGTLSLLGSDVAWQAAAPMKFDKEKGSLVGAGKVKIEHEKIKFGNEVNISTNGTQAFVAVGAENGIAYAENGIEISTGVSTAQDLTEIQPKNVGVNSPALSGIDSEPFKGDLKITSSGVTGTASKSAMGLVAIPDFLKSVSKTLEISGDGGLSYKVSLPDAKAGVEIGNLFSFYKTAPVIGDIAQNGSITYHLDGNGFALSLFGKEVTSFNIGAGMDIKCTDSSWSPINFSTTIGEASFGGFTAVNLGITANSETSTFNLTADSIKSEKLPVEFTGVTLSASPEGFTAANVDVTVRTDPNNTEKALTGKVTNLKIDPAQGLSFEGIEADFPAMTFSGITLNQAHLTGSLVGQELSFNGDANAALNVQNDFLKLNSENLTANVSFSTVLGSKTAAPEQPAAGEEGAVADKQQLGNVSVNMTGTLSAEIYAGGKSLASGEITDFSYADKTFSLGNLKAAANFSVFNDNFSGSGELTADNLTYDAANKTNFDKMSVAINESSFKGKPLPANIIVEINSGAEGQPAEAETNEDADIALDDKTEGSLTNVKLALTLGGNPAVGIGADSVGIDLKLINVSAEDFMINLSSNGISGTFGTVTASCDALNEKLKDYCGIDGISLSVGKLEYSQGGLSIEEVKGEIGASVNLIGGLSMENPSIAYNFTDRTAHLGFGLNYAGEGLVKGASGKVSFAVGNTVAFEKVEGLAFDLGAWGSGSVSGVEKTADGFNFTDITLSNRKPAEENAEPISEDMDSLLVKVLKFMPDVGIKITKLAFNNTGLVPPLPGEITINNFEKAFKLTDDITGNFIYNAGVLSAELSANKAYPKDRETDPAATEELFSVGLPVIPILPPVLTADIGVHAGAGFIAGAKVTATTSKGEDGIRTFSGSAEAAGNGDLFAGVFAGLSLKVGAASASAELSGDVKASGNVGMKGSMGFTYNSNMPLLQAFSIDRASTAAAFDLGAALAFELNFTAGGEAGLPAAIVPSGSKLKLYHTWNLLHVDLGNAQISGNVAYSEGVWVKTGNAAFDYVGKFNIDKVEEELNQLGETYETLKADMDAVNEICQKVASNGGSVLGLGEIMQDKTVKGLSDLYQKLSEIRDNGLANAKGCYELMTKVRKKIEGSAESEEKNLKEVETLNEIERQSQEAQSVIIGGVSANAQSGKGENENPYLDGMTQAEYESIMKHFEDLITNGGDELDALAKLDPAAVMNTLKVYKLDYKRIGNESWQDFRPDSKANADKHLSSVGKGLSVNTNAKKYSSNFNYNSKVFSDALKSLGTLQENSYKQIDNQQKEIDATSKRLENKKLSEKERKKEEAKLKQQKERLQELLDKNMTSARLSTSIKGFDEYLSNEKSYVSEYTAAASSKYLEGEIISQSKAEISEELLNARKEWIKSILGHMVAYYNGMKPSDKESAFKVNSRLNNQFRERQRALAGGEWFEDGMSDRYGAGSFKQKKAQASAYLNLKQTYNNVNDRLVSFFTIVESAMESTEELQKASYKELKSANDIKEKSNAILSAVAQTEQAKDIDIAADTKRIKELVSNTA